MAENLSIYQNNLQAMMRIMAKLSLASEGLIGKGANALMYQTGKDMGHIEGKKLDRTTDLGKALEMLTEAEQGVWDIELWKDVGAADYIFEEDGIQKAYVLFRECPMRQVCLTHGIKEDGVSCRITHGLFAGMLSEVMGRKVDLHVVHAGPNACKKIVELKASTPSNASAG
ncbi:MAG: hypothetical protein WCF84_13355 [Anaerolineae bacterium]